MRYFTQSVNMATHWPYLDRTSLIFLEIARKVTQPRGSI